MPDEKLLRYITELTKEAMECLYAWREAEQARLSAGDVKNKDLYNFSDSLVNHPLQSLINKLNSDHQSILNGGAIQPPGLGEFMPAHYSLSFPVTQKWSSEYPLSNFTTRPINQRQALYNKEMSKIAIDAATSPDQSGYVRVKLGDNGKPIFEPITKEEFYKKTATERDSFIEKHQEYYDQIIKEDQDSLINKVADETDSFEKNVAFMKKIERDKAMLAAKIADDINIKIEDDEQKMKDGIIERGGE